MKKLRANGYSSAQIAKLIGVTRNAVIGKAARLGLDSPNRRDTSAQKAAQPRACRPKTIFAKPPGAKRMNPAPVPPTNFAPPDPVLTQRPWLTRLPGECAFPTAGGGADTLSCCAPTGDSGERNAAVSYCKFHRRIMWAGKPRPNAGAGAKAVEAKPASEEALPLDQEIAA